MNHAVTSRKATIGIIFSIGFLSNHSEAGIPVYDGGNFLQNYISAVQSIQQTIDQAKQLEIQLQEMRSWTEESYTWENVQDVLDNMVAITDKVDYFDNTVRDINGYLEKFQDIAYYEKSPCFTAQGCSDAEREVMEKNRRDASETQKEANDAMFRMLQTQKHRLHDDARYLEQQRRRASTAQDQKAILAHANQFSLEQTKQLMQIRALLVAQQEAVTAEVMKKSNKEAQEEARQNYLFDMSKDVDYSRDKGIPLTPMPDMKSGQE